MRTTHVFTLSVLMAAAMGAGHAFAGAASDRAAQHFSAIGSGDVTTLQQEYDSAAVFQWVGGPLDGVYTGADQISALWAKFTKGQGKLEVDVLRIEESANDKGVTVNAAVKFIGKKPIPVRYILVYRGDKLVNEVWQIDPHLKADYGN